MAGRYTQAFVLVRRSRFIVARQLPDGSFQLWSAARDGWLEPHEWRSRSKFHTREAADAIASRLNETHYKHLPTYAAAYQCPKEVEVHLKQDNVERLRKYLELWTKGMADAGGIRDRISSRRAQGQMERAAGRSYWRWDS